MIKLINILNEILAEKKLCPKGKAYYDRRIAAGEKPSAYLSGRAVKVCKGLMEEDDLDEGLEDTYWMSSNGNKITLSQLLDAIKDYPIIQAPIEKVEKIIIKKDSGGIELDRLSKADFKYPIIIVVDNNNNYRYILDGNHRANKAIETGLESIPAKLVNIKKLPQEFQDVLTESLRDWFQKEDWVRIDTAGNITGPCGTMKKGNKTTRCLPRAKANSLTKAERAATSKKKAASDKQFVPNTKKAKVSLKEIQDSNIECEKCGWRWKLSDGGEDPYICHKCNFDNSYKYNNDLDEYDVENEQDIKEFIEFMREYQQQLSEVDCNCLLEAKYQGRTVPLGKPMQGDSKKFKVYVKNPKTGKVVKVNFGAKGMNIKKNNPVRRKAFRARHNCDNPGPRTKARYWSCRKW
jgi:hypothetical protein